MYFDITFIDQEPQDTQMLGEITLEDFKEKFLSDLSYWTKEDYEMNWVKGIERSVNLNLNSYFITDMHDPKLANHVFVWLIYDFGIYTIFRNHLIIITDSNPFNVDEFYNNIPNYSKFTEDGLQISEWKISKIDLTNFLERKKDRF